MTTGRVVRVVPDVSGVDKTFDYEVPDDWVADGRAETLAVGSMVRVDLHGRRVAGWVVADGVTPPDDVALKPLSKLSGMGPSPEVVDLARWAAWRWCGRWAATLRSASPPSMVRGLGAAASRAVAGGPQSGVEAAFEHDAVVLRHPVNAPIEDVPLAAARRGPALVVAPSQAQARRIGVALRRAGAEVAMLPRDWPLAAAGGRVIVGSRSAIWATSPDLASIVVIDEHDEAHKEERVPSWHVRDVALERARSLGIPCVLVSPAPTLDAMVRAPLLKPSRSAERESWPVPEVIDRRDEDPTKSTLLSEPLVVHLRDAPTVVCVLNRTGRARLLACGNCGELARCESHDAPLRQDDHELTCPVGGETRPPVCEHCGSTKLKNLRAGVRRIGEELEALANRDVTEVIGSSDEPLPESGLFVGTEAALHRLRRADVVVFLDFDQELLAPRSRAGEQALTLLVRAACLAGPRADGGRLIVQTRQPDHPTVAAFIARDPSVLARADVARRQVLRRPPFSSEALISGSGAAAFVEAIGNPIGIDVLGPSDGRWLVRAGDAPTLADLLAATQRPSGRLRIEVDPLRA